MKYVFLILFFLGANAFANDDGKWFCEQESGKREGAVIWSCGMGQAFDEGGARSAALRDAFHEQQMICQASSDCANKPRTVTPQRTSCKQNLKNNLWTCHRLIITSIQEE